MANENEPAKLLLPYLQRADELQNHDPLVAYYCRLYAMERGLKFPQSERTKTTNNLLVSLMKQLEKDKKSLKLGPDDQLHLEGFALNVFKKADKQDRAGRANLNTAKTFYAASIFFEIINQFGELQPDLEQKQKYAAWKAANIRKAINEGRTPLPGPPGGEDNFSIPTSTSSGEYGVEPSRPDPTIKSAQIPPPPSHDEIHPRQTSNIPPPFSDNSPPPFSINSPPTLSDNSPPPPYPRSNYPSHNIHPSQNNILEDPSYPQTYPQDPHQNFQNNYPSNEAPSNSYPNFQLYPSFADSSSPTAPSHYPSYYQNSDPAICNSQNIFVTPHNEAPPVPSKSNQHISAPSPIIQEQHLYARRNSSGVNGSGYDSVSAYKYDSNYEPAPETIAEAH